MDEIVIVDYNPDWPRLFEQEANRLRDLFADALFDDVTLKGETVNPLRIKRIEHVGSTAVPGLAAKPIIDIFVVVNSLRVAQSTLVLPLATLGYAAGSTHVDPHRLIFVKGLPPNGPRTHHLHLVKANELLQRHLIFRDYLRQHPETAATYAQFKRDLALRYVGNRAAYTEGKTEYIESVLQQARSQSAPEQTIEI